MGCSSSNTYLVDPPPTNVARGDNGQEQHQQPTPSSEHLDDGCRELKMMSFPPLKTYPSLHKVRSIVLQPPQQTEKSHTSNNSISNTQPTILSVNSGSAVVSDDGEHNHDANEWIFYDLRKGGESGGSGVEEGEGSSSGSPCYTHPGRQGGGGGDFAAKCIATSSTMSGPSDTIQQISEVSGSIPGTPITETGVSSLFDTNSGLCHYTHTTFGWSVEYPADWVLMAKDMNTPNSNNGSNSTSVPHGFDVTLRSRRYYKNACIRISGCTSSQSREERHRRHVSEGPHVLSVCRKPYGGAADVLHYLHEVPSEEVGTVRLEGYVFRRGEMMVEVTACVNQEGW
eukprot:PhF_6_TR30140/c0_g4_i8/m.44105